MIRRMGSQLQSKSGAAADAVALRAERAAHFLCGQRRCQTLALPEKGRRDCHVLDNCSIHKGDSASRKSKRHNRRSSCCIRKIRLCLRLAGPGFSSPARESCARACGLGALSLLISAPQGETLAGTHVPHPGRAEWAVRESGSSRPCGAVRLTTTGWCPPDVEASRANRPVFWI